MAIFFGLSSCSNDDEAPNDTNSIVGRWEWYKTSDYVGDTLVLMDYKHFEECGKDQIVFNADGTLIDIYYEKMNDTDCIEYKPVENYTISGKTIIITEDDGDTYSYDFTVTNDELKIYETGNDGTVYTSILKRK